MDVFCLLKGRKMTPIESQLSVITQTVREAMQTCAPLLTPPPLLSGASTAGLVSMLIPVVMACVEANVVLPVMQGTAEGQLQPTKRGLAKLMRDISARQRPG
jgi:hypothetical protein